MRLNYPYCGPSGWTELNCCVASPLPLVSDGDLEASERLALRTVPTPDLLRYIWGALYADTTQWAVCEGRSDYQVSFVSSPGLCLFSPSLCRSPSPCRG